MNIVKAEAVPNLKRQGRFYSRHCNRREKPELSLCSNLLKKKKAEELLRGKVGGTSELLCSQSKGK